MAGLPPISSLIRAALFVDNLERMRAFYAAIGLTEIYFEGELAGKATASVLQLPDTTVTKCLIIKPQGGQNKGMIGLFELTNPKPEQAPKSSAGPRRGDTVLVFYVTDLDETLHAAKAAGGTPLSDPILFEMPHRSQREVCLRDPEGTLINLVERPVAEADDTRSALDIAQGANDP